MKGKCFQILGAKQKFNVCLKLTRIFIAVTSTSHPLGFTSNYQNSVFKPAAN